VAVVLNVLSALLFLYLLIPIPAYANKRETGFLDRTTTIEAVNYKYQVFLPEDWTPHRKWPVILALHGAGERGSDGLLQTDVGIGRAIRSSRSAIEAIVVMPQCANNLWWTLPPMDELAMKALAEATKEFHGDTHRIYLTGLSMGGYGAWHLAQKYHGTFAALVVICGGIRHRSKVPDYLNSTAGDECRENESCLMRLLELSGAHARKTKTLADKLIPRSMHRAEVYGLFEIALQFLAKSENMIVHGVGGRRFLVSPHFFQQFITGNDAIRILHKKQQGLEFLRGQYHNLAIA